MPKKLRYLLLSVAIIVLALLTDVSFASSGGPSPFPGYSQSPSKNTPKILWFARIPMGYLADNAERFAEMGLGGVMLPVIWNWTNDPWEETARPRTGIEDAKLKSAQAMNRECARFGIDANFLKTALRTNLPDWFDDDGWAWLSENFRQIATFARLGGFKGIALDIEYINGTYRTTWSGYQGADYPRDSLVTKARMRSRQMTNAMLDGFPDMELLHFPEGQMRYGPLAGELLAGNIEAMAARNSAGGVHLLSETTFRQTNPMAILRSLLLADRLAEDLLDSTARDYWQNRCTLSPGYWPMGYYRSIYDAEGEFLGYSGRKETFGNSIVGSYADKSAHYTPDRFRQQIGIGLLAAGRYVWVNCHGSLFWQMTEEEKRRYGGWESDVLPMDERVEEYIEIMRLRQVPEDPEWTDLAAKVRQREPIAFEETNGAPFIWRIIGPFDDREKGLNAPHYPDNNWIRPATTVGKAGWWPIHAGTGGEVWLSNHMGELEQSSFYLRVDVSVTDATDVLLKIGTTGGIVVWAEDRELFRLDEGIRKFKADELTVPLHLPAGKTPVLVKTYNVRGEWSFSLRLTDGSGEPVSGLYYSLPEE